MALSADLQALGLRRGADVLVHCGLSQVGPMAAGPQTLLDALREVIGPGGTVVVPVQTANNSNTSQLFLAATDGLSPAEVAEYEAGIEAFDPLTSPSVGMGAFAEYVRVQPESVRSTHPQTSFAAIGARADTLMRVHDLDCHLGERSPIGTLYQADAQILLIGVGYESCTALHLAEYWRDEPPPMRAHRCFVKRAGQRVQLDFMARHLDASSFPELGEELDAEPCVSSGWVQSARSKLLPVRGAVDFAIRWMNRRSRREP